MSAVDTLIDMGFEKERAERAVEMTGGASVEAAMEWLIAHEGEALPPKAEGGEATEQPPSVASEGGEAAVPGISTYKCNDCGKLLRDEDAMMFHATKSGHENFSESTEQIKPLTEEEKKQKTEELRVKIKAAQAKKAEIERQEQLEKERRRRDEGKKMLETREKQKDMELRAIADERRRQKEEDQIARNRVLEQIRLDKEARKARMGGESAAAVQPAGPVHVAPPAPKVDYDKATIQVRLPNGQAVKNTFGANEPLAAVRVWLQMNHSEGQPFSLLVPFPRKMFSADDYDAPLKQLGLVPSANIVMTR